MGSEIKMVLTAKCDSCGIESEDISLNHDYCGSDLCRKCAIESDLEDLRREREKLSAWIKTCWIKQLMEMTKKIRELEKELKDMEGNA